MTDAPMDFTLPELRAMFAAVGTTLPLSLRCLDIAKAKGSRDALDGFAYWKAEIATLRMLRIKLADEIKRRETAAAKVPT